MSVSLCESPGRGTCPYVLCVGGVHVPHGPAEDLLTVYRSPSGSRLHMDRSCSAFRSCSPVQVQASWRALQRRLSLCTLCGRKPALCVEYEAAVKRFARVVRPVLELSSLVGSPSEAQRSALLRAETELSKSWPSSLSGPLEEVSSKVASLLAPLSPRHRPEPLPESVLVSAAAELVGVASDPLGRTGRRPRTHLDAAVAEVLPERSVGYLWLDWLSVARSGLVPLAEHLVPDGSFVRQFPGRLEATSDLVAEWNALLVDMVTDPGPDSYVTVPVKGLGSDALVDALVVPLADRALCQVGDRCLVAVAPRLVVRVLARSPLPGLALLGEAFEEDHPALLETALGVWDDGDLCDLPAALQAARAVLAPPSP